MDIISKPDKPAEEPIHSRELPLRPPNPHKDGDYYDRCPVDDCVEVDRMMKIGGHDGRTEHLHTSFYSADLRQGGCGALWTRDTTDGANRFRQNNGGADPKWLTRSASRKLSLPSQAYMDNYARIFKHE